MAWWMWMVLGLVLAVAEAQIPTNFFLLAFGVGGIAVGALTGLEWLATPWLEWLTFSLVSVVALVTFQRSLSRPSAPARTVDDLTRQAAMVLEDGPAGGVGRAELRGTTWSARASDGGALARGTRCRVDRMDGLTLWLRPE
jgi:membrane protein implicated in regulation of membrane protease activity